MNNKQDNKIICLGLQKSSIFDRPQAINSFVPRDYTFDIYEDIVQV